jgi:hypothetical protein
VSYREAAYNGAAAFTRRISATYQNKRVKCGSQMYGELGSTLWRPNRHGTDPAVPIGFASVPLGIWDTILLRLLAASARRGYLGRSGACCADYFTYVRHHDIDLILPNGLSRRRLFRLV